MRTFLTPILTGTAFAAGAGFVRLYVPADGNQGGTEKPIVEAIAKL